MASTPQPTGQSATGSARGRLLTFLIQQGLDARAAGELVDHAVAETFVDSRAMRELLPALRRAARIRGTTVDGALARLLRALGVQSTRRREG